MDLHERDDKNSDYEGMSREELEVLRLEKRIKRPAKDSDRLRKLQQTAVLAVFRADFTFKFAASVRACVGKTASSQLKFSFVI